MSRIFLGTILFGLLLLNSCLTPKKVVYVSDMMQDSIYQVDQAPLLRIQKNDRLKITISSKNPALAAPFNQSVGSYQVNEKGQIATTFDQSSSNKGYLVSQDGEIDLPILGSLQVEGMTLQEVKGFIRSKIETAGFIQDPNVTVELINFKINVMGAVKQVGVLEVPDGSITLLEALSKAGGIGSNAAPNKIAVIREQGGQRKKIVADIQSKDIFNSPAFHLRQNDIVYVTPKSGEITPKEENSRFFLGTGLSLITIIFTFLNWRK